VTKSIPDFNLTSQVPQDKNACVYSTYITSDSRDVAGDKHCTENHTTFKLLVVKQGNSVHVQTFQHFVEMPERRRYIK
jgi:hypothetical protein